MPRAAPLAPPPRAPRRPQLPRTKQGAARMGEGIFLLFLTPAAPDYHILRSEPKKHHSAMLQLGRLPSPAKGRTGGTQRGAGACTGGCKRASVCTHGPRLHSALSVAAWQRASRQMGQKGRPLPANVFVFLVLLLIRLGVIAFGSVVEFLVGFFFAFSLKSRDGNLHIVTQHAFPAPRWAKTQSLGTGSKVCLLSFPSHEQTGRHGKAAIGEPACLVK